MSPILISQWVRAEVLFRRLPQYFPFLSNICKVSDRVKNQLRNSIHLEADVFPIQRWWLINWLFSAVWGISTIPSFTFFSSSSFSLSPFLSPPSFFSILPSFSDGKYFLLFRGMSFPLICHPMVSTFPTASLSGKKLNSFCSFIRSLGSILLWIFFSRNNSTSLFQSDLLSLSLSLPRLVVAVAKSCSFAS